MIHILSNLYIYNAEDDFALDHFVMKEMTKEEVTLDKVVLTSGEMS